MLIPKLIKLIDKAKAVTDLGKITTQHAQYVKSLQKRNEGVSKLRDK